MREIIELTTQLKKPQLQQSLCVIAKQAGDAIMRIYTHADIAEVDVQKKSDNSPVTAADIAAHQVLDAALQKVELTDARGDPMRLSVVSEEAKHSFVYRQASAPYWLIDPLDGTKEFINRNGEFTVNIALIAAGKPVFGVVFAPVTGEMFYGGEAIGAYKCQAEKQKKIYVKSAESPYHVLASKNHLNSETAGFIAKLGDVNLVQAGSSLKFCRIAEGLADIYPRMAPTAEWDTAAAHAVLQGAGGEVVQLDGKPLVYSKTEILNPHFIAYGDVAIADKFTFV